ncbi:hypothetical protein K525DRAFT_275446 [Schizophyllum commune Loenen D]|nr:hypothetical protein K525DRAFT_275446 [Schizophyllum commune Loenen D]
MRLMGNFPTPCGHTRRANFATAATAAIAAAASHLPPSPAPIIAAPLLPPPLPLRSVPLSIAPSTAIVAPATWLDARRVKTRGRSKKLIALLLLPLCSLPFRRTLPVKNLRQCARDLPPMIARMWIASCA